MLLFGFTLLVPGTRRLCRHLSTALRMAAAKGSGNDNGYTYEDIQALSAEILKHSSLRPKIGIICGTGLGGLADIVDNATTVPYEAIPGFPLSTVKGHQGKFVFGSISGRPLLLMRGRFHYYEGYPMWKVAMPVRVMKAMGIETLIVTNAAGGLNPEFKTGDIMVIKDHIDLPGITGECVLAGKNDERFGPRFIATNGSYDKDLSNIFLETAASMGHSNLMREGVYVMVGGPTFTSLAESKLLRMFGGDAVGMSTVPEVIVSKHCGMRVFGFSLITDMVGLDETTQIEVTHEEVLQTAKERADLIQRLVVKFIDFIN